jgi:hypothetical protein
MCYADITPVAFHYNPNTGQLRAHFDTLRTCRNYDRIKNWAEKRTLPFFTREEHFPEHVDETVDDTLGLSALRPDENYSVIERNRKSHLDRICKVS